MYKPMSTYGVDINRLRNTMKIEIDSTIQNLSKELENFWGEKPEAEPIVTIVESREEIDKLRGERTDKKLVGWHQKRKYIWILDQEKFESESTFKKKDFDTILKHELSHFLFTNITKGSYPKWLNEGLACYLAGQKYHRGITKNDIEKVLKCYADFDRSLFAHSYLLVRKIIELKGEKYFVKFLKSFNENMKEEEFKILFKKFYNIDLSGSNLYDLINGKQHYEKRNY
ncbi:hypothetical protein A3F08_00080 [Candidatus Berkelbacteria bacterium RIFCSPHIGHO2_12_FULL_36_9]|uniref:Peptidase MA-like domain-containing protein n=1 Tax=Candidatus Berkelbacteria bacterium RIFCSPHIGHO2_12_FULL_36_9 TaxID=1797469 RepID=A0A1F5EF86_9BACT|nr:MAG: hypothetical protein A3F08_00080 [Candidatus Berkelbacteria bacterium RIFCSPHIGHO2_12_FULL_36_9]